jgi:Arc/MetJ family transcription regulator
MLKKVAIEIDDDLVQEAIRRYRVVDAREAVHLALRTLLGETDDQEGEQQDDEYDEFSDPSAWQSGRSGDTG